MARDIAKKATRKLTFRLLVDSNQIPRKTGKRTVSQNKSKEPVVVTASQVRNLVVNELQDVGIRPEYSINHITGHPPEHCYLQKQTKSKR